MATHSGGSPLDDNNRRRFLLRSQRPKRCLKTRVHACKCKEFLDNPISTCLGGCRRQRAHDAKKTVASDRGALHDIVRCWKPFGIRVLYHSCSRIVHNVSLYRDVCYSSGNRLAIEEYIIHPTTNPRNVRRGYYTISGSPAVALSDAPNHPFTARTDIASTTVDAAPYLSALLTRSERAKSEGFRCSMCRK